MNDWTETRLWATLGKRYPDEESNAQRTLRACLPRIQTILQSGGTSALQFTLHDHNHSFRVAERMADLLPPEFVDCATDFDLAFLLLSAYLHDIGMTPRRELANNHWLYLLTGDKSVITHTELNEFQGWLDKEWQGIEPPVEKGALTQGGLLLCEQIFSFYCRHKHNDWSEVWIRDNLDVAQGLYSRWTEDLIILCRSHHEGLSELRQSRFDARVVSNPGRVLNLRYLAAVLRLADVLEFDPERTPEVILHHRDIPAENKVYWYKDHDIAFSLDHDVHRLLLTARTPNAAVHKAVLSTIAMVDDELACCITLEQEGAFRHGTIPNAQRDRYSWPWPARLTTDVAERGRSFVFIDGAFRPNAQKILELLSGTKLYGNPLSAIRELLQNAIDAVREQIAYERLTQANPSDERLERTLGAIHRIKVSFEMEQSRYWLRCVDDGVGMTRDIIERHLLVSGSETRADVRALERDARSHGFSVGRTGQFGIGVLSYFMIADRLEITTRRSSEAGDVDGTAWHFVTEGVGTFGQLEQASRASKGTELVLRIRSDVVANGDLGGWLKDVLDYVRKTVRKAPCILDIRGSNETGIEWASKIGWVSHTSPGIILKPDRDIVRSPDLETSDEVNVRETADERWRDLEKEIVGRTKWFGPREITLPNRLGTARLWLPYFELAGGASVMFIDIDENKVRSFPNGWHGYLPSPQTLWSNKGFASEVDTRGYRTHNYGTVEVDLERDSELTVDREQMKSGSLPSVLALIEEEFEVFKLEFLRSNAGSHFFFLNSASLADGRFVKSLPLSYWMILKKGRLLEWRRSEFPLVDPQLAYYLSLDRLIGFEHEMQWRGRPVNILATVRIRRSGVAFSSKVGGGFLVLWRSQSYAAPWPMVLWSEEVADEAQPMHKWASEFPPEWASLVVVGLGYRPLWNKNHVWVASVANLEPSWSMTKEVAHQLEQVIQSREMSILFILTNLTKEARYWNAIRDNYPLLYNKLLEATGLQRGSVVSGWSAETPINQFTVSIGFDGAVENEQLFQENALKLPNGAALELPSNDWWILPYAREGSSKNRRARKKTTAKSRPHPRA